MANDPNPMSIDPCRTLFARVANADVRKKWMCCRLMSLLLLFHHDGSAYQVTGNCVDSKGCWTKQGGNTCGKNVICILERLKYHEPA